MFETLQKGFRNAKNRLAGITELTPENIEPALRDVRLSLLEADVELGVVKAFLQRVKDNTVGTTVKNTVTVGGRTLKIGAVEQFVKACQDELEDMMAWSGDPVVFEEKGVTGIMMVGLQGSGKTTSSAKLARLLEKEHGRHVLLVAADVARPGAIEQLQVLGEQIGVPVFSIPSGNPVEICDQGLKHCKKIKRDTVIFDTAGRLAIDEALMHEVRTIREHTSPANTFLVVDAMIGQDSVRTAKAFHETVGLSGVIVTKLDGDARGGAALSIKQVTGAPVKFVGTGEQMDKLEIFRPQGMASRILGMGDVVGLMKDFEGVIDEQKAEEDARRMLQGDFSLEDFLEQIEMLQSMGPLQDIFEKLPFMADAMPEGFKFDDKEIIRTKAMVSSMTKIERKNILVFRDSPTRMARVAKGSGRTPQEVAELLQRFLFMKQMMGDIGKQAGLLGRIPGFKQLAQANRMRSMVKTGGLEHNPMMAELAEQLLEAAVAGGGKKGGMPGLPPGFGGFPGMGAGFPGMPGMGMPGMGMPGMGMPGMGMPGMGMPGMGMPGMGMPGMGMPGMPQGFGPGEIGRPKVDKGKKKNVRKMQKKSRSKSRK